MVKCGVCRGISRKTVCRTWCFCGEDLVECVANVVILTVVFRRRKTGHPFELYFWLALLESETALERKTNNDKYGNPSRGLRQDLRSG
jgi:hypothetical protein